MGSFYKKIIRPVMFGIDPETAHEIGMESLRLGLSPAFVRKIAANRYTNTELNPVNLFGLTFSNPLGVAAGFDKNGVIVNQLAGLGFGFVEVGTVTLKPQIGNDRPRMFRLPDDHALINRMGFNNEGAVAVAGRLGRIERECIVGMNIGKNKDVANEDAIENYLATFELVHPVADYITINISSPNTPGLRELQHGESLTDLIHALVDRNNALSTSSTQSYSQHRPPEGATQNTKPLLVKIAPDLTEADIEMIVDACIRKGVAGIIATNTTVSRRGLRTSDVGKLGMGGLSGQPIAARSNEVIATIFRYSKGKLPIIGVGGIFTPEDAFDKIASGASLLQAYTGFVYGGPSFANEINTGLARLLKDKGFKRLEDVVGSGI